MNILLTPTAAAAQLGFSERHFRRLVRAGAIPALRFGRAVRFRHSDLVAWVAERAS
jgi:excisionase family DNA binding protein